MTYVTCPTRRYHPAVVAQKAATMQLLSDGRFTLGLGAGENLNEHNHRRRVADRTRAPRDARRGGRDHSCIVGRAGRVTYRGTHFDVESATVWEPARLPSLPSVSRSRAPQAVRLAGRHADVMIAVEPRAELGDMFDAAGGEGKPRVGQIALSYDLDEQLAVERAMEQFRWFTRQLARERRVAPPGVFHRRVEDGPERGCVGADAVRSRPRETHRRHSPVRGRPASPTLPWCKSARQPKNNS